MGRLDAPDDARKGNAAIVPRCYRESRSTDDGIIVKHRHDDELPDRAAGPTARRPDEPEHEVHRLQQLAGNQAVSAAVQRSLEVTGSATDVASMLRMLRKPSRLDLDHDRKSHRVSITGKKPDPPSPELAAKLTEVVDEPARTAKINLGRKQQGVGFGAFPHQEDKPIQELRIDHFEALEKGVPGAGTATLIHEITENFAATDPAVHETRWEMAHDLVHEGAEQEANLVLDQLQGASGAKKSGRRQAQYTFVTGKGARRRTTWAEARENQYHLWDAAPGGGIANARTAGIVQLADLSIEFSTLWEGLPSTAQPVIAQIADLMAKHPSATVVLQGFASARKAAKVQDWYWAIHGAVRTLMGNPELSTEQRYAFEPARTGDSRVQITVNRPDI